MQCSRFGLRAEQGVAGSRKLLVNSTTLVGQGLLIVEVSRLHSDAHTHTHTHSSRRVISSTQRHLPDNTQHTLERYLCPGGIRTCNPNKPKPADPRLGPRGCWVLFQQSRAAKCNVTCIPFSSDYTVFYSTNFTRDQKYLLLLYYCYMFRLL
jgi:hypothetical protein